MKPSPVDADPAASHSTHSTAARQMPAGPNRAAGRRISKMKAAWLACLFGVFGLHWWYLGRRHAWMITAFSVLMCILGRFYPSWWENPPTLLLLVPALEGIIEALVFALKPDDQFDARYNPGAGRITRTGWNAVLTAIFTTAWGALVLTWGLAFVVMYVYKSLGWLDGLVY